MKVLAYNLLTAWISCLSCRDTLWSVAAKTLLRNR